MARYGRDLDLSFGPGGLGGWREGWNDLQRGARRLFGGGRGRGGYDRGW